MANATKRYRRGFLAYLQIATAACVGGAILVDSLVALLMGYGSKSSIGRLFAGTILDWPGSCFPGFDRLGARRGFYYHFGVAGFQNFTSD
ncbi:MAG: hypothetical protein U1D30_17550 [Planctomycetota bacterium]